MLSRRSLAALALVPVMPAAGAAAALDPTLEAIARADAARQRWEAADEPTLEWTITDRELDEAQDVVFANVPSTPGGILALIRYARREGCLDDPTTATTVIGLIERAVAGMVGSR